MPRQRDQNRDKAYELYKEAGGKIDLVEIASQLNVSAGTVRGWKSKDRWEENLNKKDGMIKMMKKRGLRTSMSLLKNCLKDDC